MTCPSRRTGSRPIRSCSRSIPAHRDPFGHPAPVRGVLPLQRRHRRRAQPVGTVRPDHLGALDRARTRPDPARVVDGAAAAGQPTRPGTAAPARPRRLRCRAATDRQRPARRRRAGAGRRVAGARRAGAQRLDRPAAGGPSLGSAIRTSIKSLRSLLVEIYPANLQEEGLQSAVGDLLNVLAAQGVRHATRRRPEANRIDPEASALSSTAPPRRRCATWSRTRRRPKCA